MGEACLLFVLLTKPEVLISCMDLLACVQTLALIKKPSTPDSQSIWSKLFIPSPRGLS